MTLKEWERILYDLALKTGDPTSIRQYIRTAKYNEHIRQKESEIKTAQEETYNNDGGLTNN